MPTIVDPRGNPIKLTDRQKTEMYNKAKYLKENIRNSLCSKDETKIPNDANVKKMINLEFRNKDKVDAFRKTMQAIGADPKDYNVERLRR